MKLAYLLACLLLLLVGSCESRSISPELRAALEKLRDDYKNEDGARPDVPVANAAEKGEEAEDDYGIPINEFS